jgi:predicted amidohydrolase
LWKSAKHADREHPTARARAPQSVPPPRDDGQRLSERRLGARRRQGRQRGRVGLIGGSAIIAPTGEIAARTLGEDDEVITATLDLDLGDYIRRTIFNFEKHRRIEHYQLIIERSGAKTEV